MSTGPKDAPADLADRLDKEAEWQQPNWWAPHRTAAMLREAAVELRRLSAEVEHLRGTPSPSQRGRWLDRLAFDRERSEDSPVVRGTWVTAASVVGLVADGWTWEGILRVHPELEEADIRACLEYEGERGRGR